MKLIYKSHRHGLTTKADDLTDGQFRGYGSVFGNVDKGGDIIEKGAYGASIDEHKANGTMPSLYKAHDSRLIIGEWLDMSEDDKGLALKGQLWVPGVEDRKPVEEANGVYNQMKSRANSGLSVGIRVRDDWMEYTEAGNGSIITIIKQAELVEISATPSPMNVLALTTAVKSLEDINGEPLSIRSLERLLMKNGTGAKAAKVAAKALMPVLRDADEATDDEAQRDALQALAEFNKQQQEQAAVGELLSILKGK